MMEPVRRLASVLVLAATSIGVAVASSQADHIAGSSCGTVESCAGHEFWPRMTASDVQQSPLDRGATLRGKPGNDDELLGGHGFDTLDGGDGIDVLWGDRKASGQPRNQRDRISGGPGGDFIYTSRGINTVSGGAGNDAIKSRFGRGTVDCGSGNDIVYVPKSRRRNWKFKNCEKFEGRTEAQRGQGIKPLK